MHLRGFESKNRGREEKKGQLGFSEIWQRLEKKNSRSSDEEVEVGN